MRVHQVRMVLAMGLWLGCTDKPTDTSTEDTSGGDTAGAPDTGTDCGSDLGTVTGTVMQDDLWDELEAEIAPGARVFAQVPGDDLPIETLADSAGLFTLPLPAGTWSLAAATADLRCVSGSNPSVTVTACGTQAVSLTIDTCTRDGDTGED